MKNILLLLALLFVFCSQCYGEDYTDEQSYEQNVLYLSYEHLPKKVIKGQIFKLTIKVFSTVSHYEELSYTFSDETGLTLLDTEPERIKKGKFYFDTFYFRADGNDIQTPVIKAYIDYSKFHHSQSAMLNGKYVEVVSLNPSRNYCGVIAKNFEITDYKTTIYNNDSNILVFTATADQSILKSFLLQNQIFKQGFESLEDGIEHSRMTYYAVISSKMEQFEFSYFNLVKMKYEKIYIPIVIEEDRVSTQSNITPVEHGHTYTKVIVASLAIFLLVVMYYFRRRYIYLFFVFIGFAYIGYISVPIEHVCIKSDVPIYLLPMNNATVFEKTEHQEEYEVQGKVQSYYKIKLDRNRIGWVNIEDTCNN